MSNIFGIYFLGIILLLILLLSRKFRVAFGETLKRKSQNRLFLYFLFVVGTISLPFVSILVGIIWTGSREYGVIYGFRIPFYFINLVFAFFIIKSRLIIRLLYGLLVSVILGVSWLIVFSDNFTINLTESFDSFGLEKHLVAFILISLVAWETIYRIINKTNNYER